MIKWYCGQDKYFHPNICIFWFSFLLQHLLLDKRNKIFLGQCFQLRFSSPRGSGWSHPMLIGSFSMATCPLHPEAPGRCPACTLLSVAYLSYFCFFRQLHSQGGRVRVSSLTYDFGSGSSRSRRGWVTLMAKHGVGIDEVSTQPICQSSLAPVWNDLPGSEGILVSRRLRCTLVPIFLFRTGGIPVLGSHTWLRSSLP